MEAYLPSKEEWQQLYTNVEMMAAALRNYIPEVTEPTKQDDKPFTTDQACEFLGISRQTLTRYVRSAK
jgi:predicted DNA-binding protein (UPF0251 family)